MVVISHRYKIFFVLIESRVGGGVGSKVKWMRMRRCEIGRGGCVE
jgi:hypothetical protein